MAAGSTYTPIATTTISGTSTYTVSFSSISSAYTDLKLVFNGGASAGENFRIQFNSDTASNYSSTWVSGDGTNTSSSRQATTNILVNYDGFLSNVFSTVTIVDFLSYSNTTTYKNVLSRANNSANGTSLIVGSWRNTAAITSMNLLFGSGTSYLLSGSTFTLYGILSA